MAGYNSARSASDPRIGSGAVAVGGALGGIAALVYFGAAPWITAAFTGRPDVVAVGVVFLRWLAVYLVPMSVVISLSGALAAGRGGRRLLPVTVAVGRDGRQRGVAVRRAAGPAGPPLRGQRA